MTKDIKKVIAILLVGAAAFGGLLGWAEKADHTTPETKAISTTMRNVATLNK